MESHMRRVALLIALILAAPVLALAAQDSSTAVGQRVRIKRPPRRSGSSARWREPMRIPCGFGSKAKMAHGSSPCRVQL